MKYLCLLLYYGFAQFLPSSYFPLIGYVSNAIRTFLVKSIFRSCGKDITIDRKVFFGTGFNVVIGDKSGIGARSTLPSRIDIGNNVLMGPECCFIIANHNFERTDIPIIQ